MIEELLKDKKKLGLYITIAILLVVLAVMYSKSGYKDLRKNDDDEIFVEEASKYDSNDENISSEFIAEESIQLKDKSIVVEIKGEVNKPDVYTMSEDSIVKDVIQIAGGTTENADLSSINRAKKLQNHELIYIRNKNEATEENGISAENGMSDNAGLNETGKVNLNFATLEELKTLNGIGDAKASSILEFREQSGGFSSIEQVKEVDGIGEKMYEKIKDKIEV